MGDRQSGPDDGRETSLTDLDARIRRAREAQQPMGAQRSETGGVTGFGLAMRVGIELVAGVAVGAGVGVLLDRWLGTGPWLMIAFFFLGAGAGALNVYRAVSHLGDGASEGSASDRDGR